MIAIRHQISPRAAVVFLEGVLLSVVVGLLVIAVFRLFTPVGPIGALGSADHSSISAQTQMPAIDIFWPSNRLSQISQTSDWSLFGVYFRQEGPSAILAQGKRGEQMVFRKGDALAEGTLLSEIGADYVVLDVNGAQARLYLDDAAPITLASTADGKKPKPLSDGIVLPGPLDPALLEPYGLRVGDVLLAVNGDNVRTPSDLSGFAALQQSNQSVRVTIRRGNETLEKVLRP
ncbi:MAG: PDZ domain-containing protein [Pseudomonadota bacterium]